MNINNKPKVSIIMSTFNNAPYLKQAIESVLYQSYNNWELIIINDASVDFTKDILKQYAKKEKRIHILTNKTNKGLAASLNRGITASKGELIARLDGDDWWIDHHKLKKQVAFLIKNQDYGLVGCWANIIDENSQQISNRRYPSTDKDIRNYILIENCFFHSSVVTRKIILDKVGYYDTNIKTAEDYNLWLKIGLVSKMQNLPEFMISYRLNPNGVNATRFKYQIKETLFQVKEFKKYYPNYYKAIIMWKIRQFVPRALRVKASGLLVNVMKTSKIPNKTNG
jgi:glycosyltransferase involved in cell wall biosynthesis